ncbi:MAG TPA: DUF6622 family protein [Burkholderiaceae bacterium]|jgi:hypothetical protein|nr:DUF6622 family protein [Burkholderiaceae bacterium]
MLDFLSAILAHTPIGVWIGLALLVAFGVKQMAPRRLGTRRLVVVPVILVLASGASAWQAFGASGEARMLLSWGAGLAIGWGLGRLLDLPRGVVANDDGTFHVPGSVVPLLLMLGIFLLRYIVNVALAVSPGLAMQTAFVIGASLAYGLPSGLFAARARKVLAARTPVARAVLAA